MRKQKQETIDEPFYSITSQNDVIIIFWDTLFPSADLRNHLFFSFPFCSRKPAEDKMFNFELFSFGSAFFKFFAPWFSYAIITGIEIQSNRKKSIFFYFFTFFLS